MSSKLTEEELTVAGETFIHCFEAMRRVLAMYPADHPAAGIHLDRFLETLEDLRGRAGTAMINFSDGEIFLNGVPLKRLSMTYAKAVAVWEEKGLGLVSFGEGLTLQSVSRFFEVVEPRESASEDGAEPRELLTSLFMSFQRF